MLVFKIILPKKNSKALCSVILLTNRFNSCQTTFQKIDYTSNLQQMPHSQLFQKHYFVINSINIVTLVKDGKQQI